MRFGRWVVARGLSPTPSLPTSQRDRLDFRQTGGRGGPKDCAQKEDEECQQRASRSAGYGCNAALNAFHFASCEND